MLSLNEIYADYCKTILRIGYNIKKNKLPTNEIGLGSSRRVYKTRRKTAIKIAYNNAGIAQNINEVYCSSYNKFSNIIANIYNYDPKYNWIEMEFAQPISNICRFEEITNIEFNQFKHYIQNFSAGLRKERIPYIIPQSVIDKLDNNEFTQNVINLISTMDAMAGDLGTLSSWGMVERNHNKKVVLIDYGITYNTYFSYYKKDTRYKPTKLLTCNSCL